MLDGFRVSIRTCYLWFGTADHVHVFFYCALRCVLIRLRRLGLSVEYTTRRDLLIDALQDEFNLQVSVGTTGSWKNCVVYTAYPKPRRGDAMSEKAALFRQSKPLFSLVPPTAGMFIWLKMLWENVPGFKEGDQETLEVQLWTKLAEAGVLVGPGRYFAHNEEQVSPVEGHFRMSFSFSSVGIYSRIARCPWAC